MAETLSTRQLNRATLARQLLLRRSSLPVLDAIRHLVGLQAQAPFAPYYGLWSRLDGFAAGQLGDLLVERQAVRVVLMRGTVHLVSAADCLGLRPLMQPIMDRDLRTNAAHRTPLAGLDLAAVAVAAEALLAEQALTATELGARLAERFVDRSPASLAHAVRDLLPLVQVPPRAVWGSSAQARTTTAAAWLGSIPTPVVTIDDVVTRYLHAFGPASPSDVQTWCGLTRLREVLERLPGVRRFADADGVELFDLDHAPRPDPQTPAPVRLVAEFDNVILSHTKRQRLMSDEIRRRVFDVRNGVLPGTLLVDGFVTGTWSITRKRHDASIDVRPYSALHPTVVDDVLAEAGRLLRHTDEGATHDVRVHEADL